VLLAAASALRTACGSGAGEQPGSPVQTDSSAPPATSAPPPSPSWTPPDYGTAQPAVQAYVDFSAAWAAAIRDPAHADIASIDKYLTGKAQTLFDQSLQTAITATVAYRGTPPELRITVTTNDVADSVLPQVTLRNCPTVDDSWVEYDTETGAVVPQPPHDPPAPWARTIKMAYVRSQWTVTDLTTDSTQTCTP
jgi:hypothetical protein